MTKHNISLEGLERPRESPLVGATMNHTQLCWLSVADRPDSDVLHSYLGLIMLSIAGGEASIAEIDPTMCTTVPTRRRIDQLPWRRGAKAQISAPKKGSKSSTVEKVLERLTVS